MVGLVALDLHKNTSQEVCFSMSDPFARDNVVYLGVHEVSLPRIALLR